MKKGYVGFILKLNLEKKQMCLIQNSKSEKIPRLSICMWEYKKKSEKFIKFNLFFQLCQNLKFTSWRIIHKQLSTPMEDKGVWISPICLLCIFWQRL